VFAWSDLSILRIYMCIYFGHVLRVNIIDLRARRYFVSQVFDAYQALGEICAYLTAQEWRMIRVLADTIMLSGECDESLICVFTSSIYIYKCSPTIQALDIYVSI
jgi:hypothetical protein